MYLVVFWLFESCQNSVHLPHELQQQALAVHERNACEFTSRRIVYQLLVLREHMARKPG